MLFVAFAALIELAPIGSDGGLETELLLPRLFRIHSAGLLIKEPVYFLLLMYRPHGQLGNIQVNRTFVYSFPEGCHRECVNINH